MTFDFLMTISIWEFLYNYVLLNINGKVSKRFRQKIERFIRDERRV